MSQYLTMTLLAVALVFAQFVGLSTVAQAKCSPACMKTTECKCKP